MSGVCGGDNIIGIGEESINLCNDCNEAQREHAVTWAHPVFIKYSFISLYN